MQNQISCIPFECESFVELVRESSGATEDTRRQVQPQYLATYLESLGAKALLVESHYVDRNYADEVSAYYSRCLVPRRNSCTRIHAFSDELNLPSLEKDLALAASGAEKLEALERQLSAAYLGFIVVRPLPSVPIGRTVLRYLRDEETRRFDPATVPYTVHLLGLNLIVEGLAFQQQDRAVAACATTAIWTSLQRVCRNEGARVPTTSRIAAEAVRHGGGSGRPMPSTGLTLAQLCDALLSFEFGPDVFKVNGTPLVFRVLLNTYLRSGTPVILLLEKDCAAHAVAAVGYEFSPQDRVLDFAGAPIRCRNVGTGKIYVHDDRLGPYARAEFEDSGRDLFLKIEFPGGPQSLRVSAAAAPLYPKVRTTAHELLNRAAFIFPLLECAVKEPSVEEFFSRSGDYLRSLYRKAANPKRMIEFQKRVALSRYVGVVRCFVEGQPLLDMVWDTTDRLREESYGEHLLGLIALNDGATEFCDGRAKELQVLSG